MTALGSFLRKCLCPKGTTKVVLTAYIAAHAGAYALAEDRADDSLYLSQRELTEAVSDLSGRKGGDSKLSFIIAAAVNDGNPSVQGAVTYGPKTQEDREDEKEGRPFYKRKGFWYTVAGVAALAGGVIWYSSQSSSSGGSSSSSKEEETEEEDKKDDDKKEDDKEEEEKPIEPPPYGN